MPPTIAAGRDGDVDQPVRGLGQYRPIADGKEGHAKVGEDVAFHDRLRRQARDGVVAVPPREFVEEMRGVLLRATGSSTAINNSCDDSAVS